MPLLSLSMMAFRDFLLSAQQMFSKYEIPTTVFVVTDFLDLKTWPWFSQLEYIIGRTRSRCVQFLGRELIVQDDRMRVAVKMTQALKLLPNTQRVAQLASLRRQLGIEVPGRPPDEYEPLSWDDVRRLAAKGVEFGSHTLTHPILSRISDPAELHQEIAGSKHRLEEQLGFPPLHFAYPFGRRGDFNDETVDAVRRGGFVTAVTAQSGFNDSGSDPFQLLRLSVDPALPEKRFIELLAGVREY